MIRFSCLCIFVVACVSGLVAQDHIISRFLAATENDSQIVAQSKHASIVHKQSYFTPFISDVEFKVRNRAWDLKSQRYTVSIEPRGLGETKSIWNYNKAQMSYEKDKNGYLLNEKLVVRYVAIIDLFERKMLESTYRELITVYEDRIKVMDQLKNSTDFDLNDLIEAEKGLSKLTIQQLEESQEVMNIYDVIKNTLAINEFTGFDTSGLIKVSTIKKIVGEQKCDLDENNITLRYIKRQFELAGCRFEFEKASNRKIISSIDFSYDNGTMLDEMARRDARRSYDLNQAFIVELGIKLPFLSAGQEDLARRKIAFLDNEEEYQQVRRELVQKIKKDTSDIRALINEFEFLTARETQVDAEASLKKYLQMSGVDPLALLSIKENLIKNNMEKSLIYYSILRNFVYVLDVTGQMSKRPLKNFLFENQEIIDSD
jgi:hypothetical protein